MSVNRGVNIRGGYAFESMKEQKCKCLEAMESGDKNANSQIIMIVEEKALGLLYVSVIWD